MPLALFVTQNGQLFHVSKELSILPTDCAKKISKEAEAFTITSLFPKVTKMVSFSLPNIYIGPGIRFDIPTLKPILSIRQVYREAEVEAYYKSVPMLPPLLGIFPPIHPPIEACPDLPGPLFLAAITTGTCSTDGSPTLKEAIGREKNIQRVVIVNIFSFLLPSQAE